jgi:hypothetical protein
MERQLHDRPKLLGDAGARAARRAQLRDPHVAPLTEFVEKLRIEVGPESRIPDFDPWDGGTAAEVLFLLEAPGGRAVQSGFISRNNPDETARNFFELNSAAGIPRELTVTWNVVPWYIGSETCIRAAGLADINSGAASLHRLFPLLPRLKAVVLVGRKAERATTLVARFNPPVRIFRSPHPSPLFVNNAPGNRERILAVLHEVATYLGIRDHSP